MSIYIQTIQTLVKRFPEVMPLLSGRSRWIARQCVPLRGLVVPENDNRFQFTYREYKTYDYYLSNLRHLIQSVYDGHLGGDFIDVMANLISGQINQAYQQAWTDEGADGDIPEYLTQAAEDFILGQYDYVDAFYRDIVDARVDKKPVDGLLFRATLWANKWTEAYNNGVALITQEMGGNMIWELGATETHCNSCSALNGIVARASEWDELGVHPQGAPNDLIECGGWQCDCSLKPTDKRRSPKAYESIMNAVNK